MSGCYCKRFLGKLSSKNILVFNPHACMQRVTEALIYLQPAAGEGEALKEIRTVYP